MKKISKAEREKWAKFRVSVGICPICKKPMDDRTVLLDKVVRSSSVLYSCSDCEILTGKFT